MPHFLSSKREVYKKASPENLRLCADNILEMVGSIPTISLRTMLNANIFAKAEFLNPSGSIKDRITIPLF